MAQPARIAITTGEPAGIGPDIVLQLIQQPQPHQLVALADPALLQQRAQALGLALKLHEFQPDSPRRPTGAGECFIVPVPLAAPVTPGQLNPANAAYVLRLLDLAVHGCQQGQFDAMVTAPVNKAVMNEAGISFSGHTEYLAALTHAPQVVMMLATRELKVALATTHLPLQQVSPAITPALLRQVITIIHHDMQQYFGLPNPRLLICGLNPHAGEDGHLGSEEQHVIIPVLQQLRAQGMALTGPAPADTAFTPHMLQHADVVLAMYHDQGLPVLKFQGFGRAVNITLGLPIVRTSVDHGTALDLAATGKADIGSLQTAIDYAVQMSTHRR